MASAAPSDQASITPAQPPLCLQHHPLPGESAAALAERHGRELRARQLQPLLSLAFGPLPQATEVQARLSSVLGALDWPFQWVEGQPCDSSSMVGLQTFAIPRESARVSRFFEAGRVLACSYSDAAGVHCFVGALGGDVPGRDPAAQTDAVFAQLARCLASCGLALPDLIRTWFYNTDILSWYSDFNRVRNAHYAKEPFRLGASPASTAVAGLNPAAAALQLAGWATRPHPGGDVHAREIFSPLQCPASNYGSAFSRAVELASGGSRRLSISGTASIEPGGRTVHQGDPRAQISLTMDVVEALLCSRGFSWSQTQRATAYFKRPEFLQIFRAHLRERGLASLPALTMCCDICRDDLLFEIELDAVD